MRPKTPCVISCCTRGARYLSGLCDFHYVQQRQGKPFTEPPLRTERHVVEPRPEVDRRVRVSRLDRLDIAAYRDRAQPIRAEDYAWAQPPNSPLDDA